MKKTEERDSVKGSDTPQEEVSGRRKLVKSLLAGSAVVAGSTALPQTWTRPVTEIVMLPAHAQATCGPNGGHSHYFQHYGIPAYTYHCKGYSGYG